MDTRHNMNNINSAIQALDEKKQLITKSFLKKYGDKSKLIFYPQKRNKKDLVGLLFVGKVRANQILDLEYNIDDYNQSFFDYIIKLQGVPEEDNIETSINSIINFKLESNSVDDHIEQTCTCNILNNSAKCNAQTCLYNEHWSLYIEISNLSQFEIEVIDATNQNLDVIIQDKFDIFYIKDREDNECELTSVAIFSDIQKTTTQTDDNTISFTYSSVLKEIVPIIYDYKEKDFKFIQKPKFLEDYKFQISKDGNQYWFKSDLADYYSYCDEDYESFRNITIESEHKSHTIMQPEESNIIKFQDRGFKYNLIYPSNLNQSHSYDNNRDLQNEVNDITHGSIGSGTEKTFWPGNIHFNNLPIDYLTQIDQSSRSIVSRFSEHAKSTTFLDNDLKLTNNIETKSLICTIGEKTNSEGIVNYSLHTTILEYVPTINKNEEAEKTYITVGCKNSNGVNIPLVQYTTILKQTPLLGICNKSEEDEYGIYTSEVYTTIGNKKSNSITIPYSEKAGYVKSAIKFSEAVVCKYIESDGILSKLDDNGNEITTTTNIIDGEFKIITPRFKGVEVIRHDALPADLNNFYTHLGVHDSATGLVDKKYKSTFIESIPFESFKDGHYFRIDFNKHTDAPATINPQSEDWNTIINSESMSEYFPEGFAPNNMDDIFSINGDTFYHKPEKFLYLDINDKIGDMWKTATYNQAGVLGTGIQQGYQRGEFYVCFDGERMFQVHAGYDSAGASGSANQYLEITPRLDLWRNATRYTTDTIILKEGFNSDRDSSSGIVTLETSSGNKDYKLSGLPDDWFKLSNYFSDAYKQFFSDTFGTDPFYITDGTKAKRVILGSDGLLISDGKTQWKNGVVTAIS